MALIVRNTVLLLVQLNVFNSRTAVLKTVKAGNSVVVVVSAMGKTTDGLVKLANQISIIPVAGKWICFRLENKSQCLLSMALQELGQPAISLTGAQVGRH